MNVLDRSLVKVTEQAAIATHMYIGKLDKELIDAKAVEAMQKQLKTYDANFKVCSGEGAIDNAPELTNLIEKQHEQTYEIIVDPIEGTNLAATLSDNAISVMAIGHQNSFRQIPDMYALKIFSPHNLGNILNTELSIEQTLELVAQKSGKPLTKLVVAVLDKPRHKSLIKTLKSMGVCVSKISDGDVLVSLEMLASKKYDLFYSVGGSPEGMINAAIINLIGGSFVMKLLPMELVHGKDNSRSKASEEKLCNQAAVSINQDYDIKDLIYNQNYAIIASGITNSQLLKGVSVTSTGKYKVNSIYIDAFNQSFIYNKIIVKN